ncbi:hypothetical protein DENIS_4063 [Desulfonema ishimotonii]|uniref:Lipoprotein SmpA/OmlA domain-containing protein n=1 Tax=Desulfonema ishimotonii TaxID=45657 RepID=A0A401G1I6_9BACT|nr:DUF3862 domain-containing protein [Desulfonema ishimotonii]GBC63074.1 hypothetical protein DENIS_4063 [Desulfonema ishimotonii]
MRRKLFRKICVLAVSVLLCISLISCAKVTRSNFDKIQEGMTLEEVIGILGEPADSSSVDLKIVTGTAAKWVDEKTGNEISVQFVNGKVKFKQFESPYIP